MNEQVIFFNTLGANNNLSDFISQLQSYGVSISSSASAEEAISSANNLFSSSPLTWNSFIGSLSYDYQAGNWTTSQETINELTRISSLYGEPSSGLRVSSNFWDGIKNFLPFITGGGTTTTTTTGTTQANPAIIITGVLAILALIGIGLYFLLKK